MILNLQSTTFSEYGGIPTYNRLVCRVLDDLGHGGVSHVLIATDSEADIETPALEFPHLRLQAFDHNRVSLVLKFLRLSLKQPFDLVLLGHVNYAPLGWLLKKLRPQMRYGVMLYGVDAWKRLPPLKRRALQQANFLISISDYTKRKAIAANGLTQQEIYLLPNALEARPNDEKPFPSPVTSEKASLLSVCRLDKSEQYKGVDHVIEALPQVAARVPNVQYIVIGGGTDLERHRRLAVELGVEDRVRFMGFVSDEALQEQYNTCDLFVMPSAGEGFGFVFLEAMKYRKPIIAANSGGAPEVVQDGITGELVAYGDRQRLAEALIGLCLNPAKRARMGDAGYQRLQDNFTFQHFNKNFAAILQQQMSREVLPDALSSASERTVEAP